MSTDRYTGDHSGYQAYTNQNRSSGYDSAATINAHPNAMYETSNPSNGYEQKWAQWFGQPPFGHYQTDNYAMLGHENYQLPTAYIGRNLHIEKMLNVSIASEDDYYTRVLLPWKVYDGMKITYSRWSGFDHMMAQVPEEVPAPQIQTRFEQGEAYQQRYGLAFKMEHGFQKTEMGQQAYFANLAIISQAVLRTVYTRIMQVLVNQRNMLAVFAQRAHHNNLIQAREVSKLAVHSFGALQKNTFGMDMVIGQIEGMFRAKMLAQPDAIVLPQGCMQYLKTCKPEERVFALCGEMARRLELDTTRSLTTNVYKNNYQIFEHKPMTVSDDTDAVNMLQREREVGNVFRLFRNPDEEYDNYAAPTAIKVIDHDKQRWAMLTLGDVLARTGVWNPDVTIRVDDRAPPAGLRGFGSPHLTPSSRVARNPLHGCSIIGDLDTSQLHGHTIRAAVRSIERLLNITEMGVSDVVTLGDLRNFRGNDENQLKAILAAKLRSICANNIWYNDNTNMLGIFDQMDRALIAEPDVDLEELQRRLDALTNINSNTSAASATVNEVAEALQTSMLEAVVADDPTPEINDKVNSEIIKAAVQDAVSITSDMSNAQRGSIASALVRAAPGFKSSKSALRKVIRNKDQSKQRDIDAAFGEALKRDMASNWKKINSEAKNIAAKIGMTSDGDKEEGDFMKGGFASKMFKNMKTIANMGLSGTQRAIARWYLGCSIDLPTIVSLDHQGIVTPFGAYVFRPMQSFTMGSAVVMRSGTDTGFTACGNSDFILGDSATNKTHLGHFTFYFEPVVTEQNHIMVARDVCFMGYNGGCGVEFFDSWTSAFHNSRSDGHAPSLLAALAFQHESEEKHRHDPISLSGKFNKSSILHALNGGDDVDHYQTAPFYRQFIEAAEVDTDTRSAGDDGFYNVETNNYICYQGLQAERGPAKTFSQYTTNTGHLGDAETTDSSLSWSGMLSMKTPVNYHHAENTVSLLGKST